MSRLDRCGNYVFTEVDRLRIFCKQPLELFPLENIDSHRSKKRAALCFLCIKSELSSVYTHRKKIVTFGFLFKLDDASRLISLQQTKLTGRTRFTRNYRDSDVSVRLMMALEEIAVVHAIQVIAGENQQRVDAPVSDVRQHLPHSVGSSLEPLRTLRSLFRSDDLDEP